MSNSNKRVISKSDEFYVDEVPLARLQAEIVKEMEETGNYEELPSRKRRKTTEKLCVLFEPSPYEDPSEETLEEEEMSNHLDGSMAIYDESFTIEATQMPWEDSGHLNVILEGINSGRFVAEYYREYEGAFAPLPPHGKDGIVMTDKNDDPIYAVIRASAMCGKCGFFRETCQCTMEELEQS